MSIRSIKLFVFALPLLFCLAAAAGETPIFRAGLLTDTHWTEDPKSFTCTEAALRVFKREKTDIVCNIGDIADVHCPAAYRYYRKLFASIFPKDPPLELFVYANHDMLVRGKPGKMKFDEAFSSMRREMGIPHAAYHQLVFRGYPILVIPQYFETGKFEAMLAEASAKFPDKPIIVLDHVPALDYDKDRERIYERYPNVVHIYGHVHVPLRNEASIRQAAFTEVNAGCLQVWQGELVGSYPSSKSCDEFAIMDVFKDKLVFRRYSAGDGRECKPPWVVPWPFDPATAPYRYEARKAAEVVPEFSAGAELKLAFDKPFSALKVSWPEAVGGGEVYKYHVGISEREADGKFREFSRQDSYSEFYLPEDRRKGKLAQKLSSGFFEAGRRYRVSVTPVGFFGGAGKPLVSEFSAPEEAVKPELVFESRDPMKELVFASGLSGGSPLPVENCFYRHRIGNARLIIPEKYWAGPKGTRFRLTVEVDTRQTDDSWTMVLRYPVNKHNAMNRLQTVGGKVDDWRYVIEFRKRKAECFYYLLIREGGPGLIRFRYVKLERLPR